MHMFNDTNDQGGEMQTKRQANFEILRVLAMIMVVVLHYLSHSDSLLALGVPATSVRITGSLIESFCIVAVNVWVLISGYFLSQSGFKLKRILQIICEIFFYTAAISLVMQSVNVYQVKSDDTIFKSVQYFFPIASEHYWFATSYVMMYLLSPVMNKGIQYLSRRQLKATILGLLFWFCLIKSFVPVNFPTDDFGYGLKWFMCLYLIAAYIRKYDVRIVSGALRSALLYVISCGLIFVMTLVLYLVNARSGRFDYYFSVMSHYNFVLCLTGALGIFSLFRYMTIREGMLANLARVVAPLTFGVYLFHEHLEIRTRWLFWMESLFGPVPTTNPGIFLVHLLLSVTVIFLAGIFIDWIRSMVFEFIARLLRGSRLMRWLNRLDRELRLQED